MNIIKIETEEDKNNWVLDVWSSYKSQDQDESPDLPEVPFYLAYTTIDPSGVEFVTDRDFGDELMLAPCKDIKGVQVCDGDLIRVEHYRTRKGRGWQKHYMYFIVKLWQHTSGRVFWRMYPPDRVCEFPKYSGHTISGDFEILHSSTGLSAELAKRTNEIMINPVDFDSGKVSVKAYPLKLLLHEVSVALTLFIHGEKPQRYLPKMLDTCKKTEQALGEMINQATKESVTKKD